MQQDRIVLIATVAGAALFLALALAFLYNLSPYADTSNNLQLLSIGLSFVTSVLLLGIYGVLAVRQGSQNELQERQEKLMEASHEPLLQVLDVDSYSEFIWPKMRNIGNGPTKDMRAAIHFYYEPGDLKVDTEEAPPIQRPLTDRSVKQPRSGACRPARSENSRQNFGHLG